MDLIIAGIGTGVGKTIVSAALALHTKRGYWKPIQTGQQERDAETVENFTGRPSYPEAYRLKAGLSPYAAAEVEGAFILPEKIVRPKTEQSLVIEMTGGALVPVTQTQLMIDLFSSWKGVWIVVSQHYLGSINHTLLTVEALRARSVVCGGIIFTGKESPHQEEIILSHTKLRCIGRLLLQESLDREALQRSAETWDWI